MNKVINISIDKEKFDLEDDAFEELNQYLVSLRQHFSTHEDRENIIQDIENSIAEKFNKKLGKSKQVITIDDVREVIYNIGTIEDFQKFDYPPTKEKPKSAPITKKLYRDPDNEILSGVSAGLGHYFEIDPIWIRLTFVLTTIFSGVGLIVYIILWIVMPQAKTRAQKIEMYGDEMKLLNIERNWRSESSTTQTQSGLKKFIGIFLIIISAPIILFMSQFLAVGMPSLIFLIFFAIFILPFAFLLFLGIKLAASKKNQEKSL